MLVCGSNSSVFVREKCWYVVVIALCLYGRNVDQHFSLTNTELWLPHTNISPLQTQSYEYHIPTFLSYKHRAMTTTYQHFSLTNTELWLPHTNIYPLQTQSYDYHIPTFLSYKHRAMTTTYQHFSLTKTELWLPHINISPLHTQL
jgi:threonine synthase